MSTDKKALPVNENNKSKPVQEGMSSAEQRPMGTESDLEQNEEYAKEKDVDTDTNSVGIMKDSK